MTTGTDERILEKVRGLLNKANGSPFEAEADAFRAKADELMVKYAIEQHQLQGKRKDDRFGAFLFGCDQFLYMEDPVTHYKVRSPLSDDLTILMYAVARHCRLIMGHWKYRGNEVAMTMIGTKSDFEYFELLFTSLMLDMTRQLLPSYDMTKNPRDNIALLKNAGFKWERIAELLAKHADIPVKRNANGGIHGWYISQYKNWCKEHSFTPLKSAPTMITNSFSAGYVQRVNHRMIAMRQEQAEPGQGLILLDMSKDLKDWVEANHPDQLKRQGGGRTIVLGGRGKTDGASYARGAQAGNKADLSGANKLPSRGQLGS